VAVMAATPAVTAAAGGNGTGASPADAAAAGGAGSRGGSTP
jgi:hypothetical protein